MAAGLPSDISTLNRVCGQAVVALAQALDTCTGLNTMLQNAERGFAVAVVDDEPDDPLVNGGMSAEDAATLRDAFEALALLAQVAYGQIAQSGAEPSNFFFQAQQLMGCQPL